MQRIFRERTDRATSVSAIAKLLNGEGIPTRTGSKWSPTVVKRILDGREVLGEFWHDGEWLQGQHEPIVDEATWEAAQALSAQGSKYGPKGRSAGRLPTGDHVFVRGALRCGVCGEAMLPRTDGGRQTYVCRTRKQTGGESACSMPTLRRVDVDVPALRLFEEWALDVDSTREHIGAQLGSRIDETRSQAERAGREVQKLRAQRERIERDYRAEELGAAAYSRVSANVAEELDAAEAEHARLTAQAERVSAGLAGLDTEHETLTRLAEMRAAISRTMSESAGAGDAGALRSAIARTFVETVVIPRGLYGEMVSEGEIPERWADGWTADLCAPVGDDLLIVPVVRLDRIADPLADRPAGFLERVGLALGVDPAADQSQRERRAAVSGVAHPSASAARSAMTRDRRPPCQASGLLPGSSTRRRGPGIAAAYASPTASGCPGSGSSRSATTTVGTAIAARSSIRPKGCERGTARSASATAPGCSCAAIRCRSTVSSVSRHAGSADGSP